VNVNILLVGIAKDTNQIYAHQFKNHVMPVTARRILDEIPNTDRMLLQSVGLLNHDKLKVPWSLVITSESITVSLPNQSSL
jgi:hypothetical protein